MTETGKLYVHVLSRWDSAGLARILTACVLIPVTRVLPISPPSTSTILGCHCFVPRSSVCTKTHICPRASVKPARRGPVQACNGVVRSSAARMVLGLPWSTELSAPRSGNGEPGLSVQGSFVPSISNCQPSGDVLGRRALSVLIAAEVGTGNPVTTGMPTSGARSPVLTARDSAVKESCGSHTTHPGSNDVTLSGEIPRLAASLRTPRSVSFVHLSDSCERYPIWPSSLFKARTSTPESPSPRGRKNGLSVRAATRHTPSTWITCDPVMSGVSNESGIPVTRPDHDGARRRGLSPHVTVNSTLVESEQVDASTETVIGFSGGSICAEGRGVAMTAPRRVSTGTAVSAPTAIQPRTEVLLLRGEGSSVVVIAGGCNGKERGESADARAGSLDILLVVDGSVEVSNRGRFLDCDPLGH